MYTHQINVSSTNLILDILTWADGYHDLIDIANKCEVPAWTLVKTIERLVEEGLLVAADNNQHHLLNK